MFQVAVNACLRRNFRMDVSRSQTLRDFGLSPDWTRICELIREVLPDTLDYRAIDSMAAPTGVILPTPIP